MITHNLYLNDCTHTLKKVQVNLPEPGSVIRKFRWISGAKTTFESHVKSNIVAKPRIAQLEGYLSAIKVKNNPLIVNLPIIVIRGTTS